MLSVAAKANRVLGLLKRTFGCRCSEAIAGLQLRDKAVMLVDKTNQKHFRRICMIKELSSRVTVVTSAASQQ